MILELQKSIDTPYIKLQDGLINMVGRLMPENIKLFIKPVEEWVNKYLEEPADFTKIELEFSYLNSCSTKRISDLLKQFNQKYKQGYNMKIFWIYEEGDDTVKEIGDDLQSMLEIPFEFCMSEVQQKERKRLKVKNKLTGRTGEISQKYWETIQRNGHERDFELLESFGA